MTGPSQPSPNSPSSSPTPLESTLRATRFRLRLTDVESALLLMLALGVAGTLAIIVADHVVTGGLSLWTRWTLRWIVIGVEACLLIAMIALPLLRRISNLYAARQMEKADPSFHNDLTAAVQLQGQSGPAAATAAAVRRSAARQIARMPNGAPMQKRGLRLASLAAAAAVTAFCLYWIFAPKSTVASFQRAMGLGDPPAPTRTQILSFTPDDETTVLTGDEVPFEARLRYPQGPAVLQIARDARTVLDEDILTMTPVEEPGPGEAYRAAWKAVSASGWAKFRLTCGDAETPWRRIQVLPTPALRRVQVKCDWPKYTHLPPRISEGGRVEGPVGTQATVTAEANLPVRRATLEFEADGRILVMTPDESGKIITTTFRVNKPGNYVIRYELRDVEAEAKSISHEVVVTPDHPPTVRLDQPTGETTLAENESLNVRGEVTDDFGVGQVELVCIRKDGKTTTHSLLQAKAPGASSRRLQANINAGSLGRAGETITCVVQARDLNPAAGGQAARSRPFPLTITPPRTTAEQQEAAEGQGQPHEAGDVPAGQAKADEAQPDAAGEQGESQIARAEAGETPAESEEQQPGDPNSPPKSEEEPQPRQVASNGNSEETPSDSQEAKQLDQLCKAMKEQGRKGECEKGGQEGQSEGKDEGKEGEGGGKGKSGGGRSPAETSNSNDGQGDADNQNQQSQAGQEQESGDGKNDEKNSSSPDSTKTPGQPQAGQQTSAAEQAAGEQAGQGQQQGQQQSGQPAGSSPAQQGAQVVHDKGGQGAETRKREGDLDAVDDQVLMPGTAQPLKSVGEALDKARRQIKSGDIDPKLLEAMNMTAPQFKDFVEKYTAEYDKALWKNRENQKETVKASRSIDDDVQHGVENKTGNVTADASVEKHRAKEDRGTLPADVSPEYRKQLEAYLRAVSEGEEK